MTDTTHEAPERIWAWGWRADSVWQEQTWQHEDEPMGTMEYVRADLVEAAEQHGYASAMEAERKLHEARIEELEAKLAQKDDLVQAAVAAERERCAIVAHEAWVYGIPIAEIPACIREGGKDE